MGFIFYWIILANCLKPLTVSNFFVCYIPLIWLIYSDYIYERWETEINSKRRERLSNEIIKESKIDKDNVLKHNILRYVELDEVIQRCKFLPTGYYFESKEAICDYIINELIKSDDKFEYLNK